jgi:hypothetical protein
LTFEVRDALKDAMGTAYGKPFTNVFDDELLSAVTKIVAMERA